jgi:hypothetical protein
MAAIHGREPLDTGVPLIMGEAMCPVGSSMVEESSMLSVALACKERDAAKNKFATTIKFLPALNMADPLESKWDEGKPEQAIYFFPDSIPGRVGFAMYSAEIFNDCGQQLANNHKLVLAEKIQI